MQGLNQIRLIQAHQAAESFPVDKGDRVGPFLRSPDRISPSFRIQKKGQGRSLKIQA